MSQAEPNQPPPSTHEVTPPETESPDHQLFEQVLDETISSDLTDQPLEPEEMQALVEVARRYPNESLSLDPIAIELVQTVLRGRFEQAVGNEDVWKAMTHQVAETMMDDDPTRQRLERFWDRLCETP